MPLHVLVAQVQFVRRAGEQDERVMGQSEPLELGVGQVAKPGRLQDGPPEPVTRGGNIKMYGRAEYLKIEKPGRIVYTQQFCDEKEQLSRHPLAPTWPATMLTTVQLTEEGPDRTRVTVTWECHGATTCEEVETFINGRAGMTQGWTGSFDKLEALLAE